MRDETTVVNFTRDDEPDMVPESGVVTARDALSGDDVPDDPAFDAAPLGRTRNQPLPPRVGGALVGLVIVGLGVLWYSLNRADSETSPWELAESELRGSITDLRGVVESRHNELKGELTSALQAWSTASEARYAAALEETRSALSDDTAALAARLENFEQRLTGLNDRIAAHDTQIGAMRERSASRPADAGLIRAAVSAAVGKYDRRWRELADDFAAGYAPGVTAPASPVANTPLPFQIVSMDLWDGKPQLAIRDDDTWHFLRVGDQLRGWTVASADFGTGTVGWRDPQNRLVSSMLAAGGASSRPAGQRSPVARDGLPTLTVETTPEAATVMVMNIAPKYHDQMALRPGAYDILVKHPGFQPYRRWIRLGAQDRALHVTLTRQ